MDSEMVDRMAERLDRIEQKLDTLIAALAEQHEDQEGPTHDLEGNPLPGEREPGQPL